VSKDRLGSAATVIWSWKPPTPVWRPKLRLAARLRQETTLSVKQITERLHLGKPKGARTSLHKFMNRCQTDSSPIQMEI
jgi:hypothetical protein